MKFRSSFKKQPTGFKSGTGKDYSKENQNRINSEQSIPPNQNIRLPLRFQTHRVLRKAQNKIQQTAKCIPCAILESDGLATLPQLPG